MDGSAGGFRLGAQRPVDTRGSGSKALQVRAESKAPPERIAALEAEIVEYCGQLDVATYRRPTLRAEFDVVRGGAGVGTRSCAHWLNWKCGVDLGAARETLRVAHALRGLPRTAAAMASGVEAEAYAAHRREHSTDVVAAAGAATASGRRVGDRRNV